MCVDVSTFVCVNIMLQGGAEWEHKYTEGEIGKSDHIVRWILQRLEASNIHFPRFHFSLLLITIMDFLSVTGGFMIVNRAVAWTDVYVLQVDF